MSWGFGSKSYGGVLLIALLVAGCGPSGPNQATIDETLANVQDANAQLDQSNQLLQNPNPPPSEGVPSAGTPSQDQPGGPPSTTAPPRIKVKPVFLVPTDAAPPGDEYAGQLMTYLTWAQTRYREMLAGMDSFELAVDWPVTVNGKYNKAYYTSTNDAGAEAAVLEMFAHDNVDRMSCPYIYLVLFAGTDNWPTSGGHPINGGINTGGGILVMAAADVIKSPNFESTLQHELGHTFGLPHVDVYGYDMNTSDSIMSYNPAHHTDGFMPSPTPGRLIPEDYRALSYAKRVFPGYVLDPARDYPAGYQLKPMVFLGPMSLTGQPDYTGPSIVQ